MAKADTLRYIKNAKDSGLSRLHKWWDDENKRISDARDTEVEQITRRLQSKLAAPANAMVKALQAAGVRGYDDLEEMTTAKMVGRVIDNTLGLWQVGSDRFKAEDKAKKEVQASYEKLVMELNDISMKAEQAVLLTGMGEELKAALKELDVFLAKIR